MKLSTTINKHISEGIETDGHTLTITTPTIHNQKPQFILQMRGFKNDTYDSTSDPILTLFSHVVNLDAIYLQEVPHLMSMTLFELIGKQNRKLSHLTVQDCGVDYKIEKIQHFFTENSTLDFGDD